MIVTFSEIGRYYSCMNKTLDIILILGFLAIDFFFFHDFFKPGEVTTLPQMLAGVLSAIVIIRSGYSLFRR